MQPPQFVAVPVAPVKFQGLIKTLYQHIRCVQVGADRNKHQQLQDRVQLMKDNCIISSRACPYALLNLQYQNALLQQQGAEMQQILPTEFICWSGYFKHVKKDQGAKRERKLQRQPAPMWKVGIQPNVDAQ